MQIKQLLQQYFKKKIKTISLKKLLCILSYF